MHRLWIHFFNEKSLTGEHPNLAMSLLRTTTGTGIGLLQSNAIQGGFTQIRNATKRASGSKTNKNDSAGRRLGPKKFENNFVNPGEIIMRQRGSKIHPGENVAIGRDHTIFAMEPGYVKFYLDPFHPLRKFVGVALKKDQTLPVDHFAPRVRRFGYEQIMDETEAKKEEDHMSRKEYLAQEELKQMKEKRETAELQWKKNALIQVKLQFPDIPEPEKAAERLSSIAALIKAGQSLEQAREQVTFNYVFEQQLAQRRGELLQETVNENVNQYKQFATELDLALALDQRTRLHKPYSVEELQLKKDEVIAKLDSDYTGIILKDNEKRAIMELLNTPGIFSNEEIFVLKQKYIPAVLPESVPGTVLDIPKGKKLPDNAVVVKTFDLKTRSLRRVVRTKDAFP